MPDKIDWRAGLKDSMWGMFWMGQNAGKSADTEADKRVLKEHVARLIRLTTQKIGYDAAKRGLKNGLDWNSLDTTIMTIVCAATSLALSGEFGEMPEHIEGDSTTDRKGGSGE